MTRESGNFLRPHRDGIISVEIDHRHQDSERQTNCVDDGGNVTKWWPKRERNGKLKKDDAIQSRCASRLVIVIGRVLYGKQEERKKRDVKTDVV